jgi:predicted nucleotidyltransferase
MFSQFFPNQTLMDVFLYFILNPVEETYLARIVESTDKALIQVQRSIKRLVDSGLVSKSTHHNKTYYKTNTKHVAYDELRHLAIQAKIFSAPFEADLQHLENKVDFAFVYGSIAKGSNTPESDIDLFFVGSLSHDDIRSFIFMLGRELVQEINVIILSPSKLEKLIADQDPFILNVIKGSKIWLFGDKNEFKEIYQ